MNIKKIFIVFIVIILSGCTTNDEKVKALIKENLSKKINDFKSYEPVDFGSLDSVFTSFVDKRYEIDKPLSEFSDDELYKLDAEIEEERKHFKPTLEGFRIVHSFRAKNAFGAYIIEEWMFFFDREITKVLNSYNIEAETQRRNELLDNKDLNQIGTTLLDPLAY